MSITSERTDGPAVESPEASTDVGAVGRAQVDEGLSARRRLQARLVAGRGTPIGGVDDTSVSGLSPVTVSDSVETEVLTNLGPRARVSLLATLGLMLGVISALAVLTGVLAGPGLVLGGIAVMVSIGGIRGTRQRHVAGRAVAVVGLLLGLAAAVVGGFALDGMVPWLSAESEQVTRVRDWLDAYVPWLFP